MKTLVPALLLLTAALPAHADTYNLRCRGTLPATANDKAERVDLKVTLTLGNGGQLVSGTTELDGTKLTLLKSDAFYVLEGIDGDIDNHHKYELTLLENDGDFENRKAVLISENTVEREGIFTSVGQLACEAAK